MEVINIGFFSLGCVQRVVRASDFHIADVFSNFTSDHLYFPKHFTYTKQDDCHVCMVLFQSSCFAVRYSFFGDLCDLEHLPGKNI